MWHWLFLYDIILSFYILIFIDILSIVRNKCIIKKLYLLIAYHYLIDSIRIRGDIVWILINGVDIILISVVVVVVDVIVYICNQTENKQKSIRNQRPEFLVPKAFVIIKLLWSEMIYICEFKKCILANLWNSNYKVSH